MTTTAVAKNNVAKLEEIIYQAQGRIAEALPAHIKPTRMISVALDLVRGDSAIQPCLESSEGQISILQGILDASQLGLMLGKNLGHAYLVAFKDGNLSQLAGKEVKLAQMMIGYRGFVHLMKKGNDQLAHVYSRIVFPDEPFEIQEGAFRNLTHQPNLDAGVVSLDQQGQIVGIRGAYTMMIYKEESGIPPDFEWMSLVEIEKRHQASRAKSGNVPWTKWTEEMIKKTPIRHAAKRMELSPELSSAVVRDEYRELVTDASEPIQIQAPAMEMPRSLSGNTGDQPAAPPPVPETELEPPVCEEHGPMALRDGRYGPFYSCQRGCPTKNINVKQWAEEQAEKAAKPPEESTNGLITQDQRAELQALALQAEFSEKQAVEILGGLSFESWDQVTVEAFPEVKERFEAFLEKDES